MPHQPTRQAAREAAKTVTQKAAKTLLLFNYDWDQAGFERHTTRWPMKESGFDLFSFPSNARLAWFDMERFASLACLKAKWWGATAVTSQHEQFGALCAALVAEKMGWPGTPVKAVLACQHKLYAREVLQRICPQANIPFARLDARYGGPIPAGLKYPLFVKPVKAAFSVLANTVHSDAELFSHTRFGRSELWVIRHLVEPFEKLARQYLPSAGTAHSMMVEQPVKARQYSLDGYVYKGQFHMLGCVDSVMYPGTDAFMRFDYPSTLNTAVQEQAASIARQFLSEVGFTHGLFNMEFFHDPVKDQCLVIEFNPRMASQFSDLYARVKGIDLHEIALALAHDIDPASLPRHLPTAKVASSFVYRYFDPAQDIHTPSAEQRQSLQALFPDAILIEFPKPKKDRQRDFKWLRSIRYACLHLGAGDWYELDERCRKASQLLSWTPPLHEEHASLARQTGTGEVA